MTDTAERRELTAVSPPARKGNPWLPTFGGMKLVVGIELRRRRPTGKGYVLYGILFAVVVAICILAAVVSTDELSSVNLELVLVMVLGVGMLIAPSLSATSINGDSAEGVLAPLQMTHLTAGDIAFGKLIASWFVSVIALAALSPFLVFAYLKSGWQLHELAITIGAILLVVLAFTAVGLAWSALSARAIASVSLAHLTTGFFAIGTLVLYAVVGVLVSDTYETSEAFIDYEQLSESQGQALENAYMTGDWSEINPDDYVCISQTWQYSVVRTNEIAGLLLANPVVMISETAPIVDPETWKEDGRAAPGLFAEIHAMVAGARMGPDADPYNAVQGNYYQSWDECAAIAENVAQARDGGVDEADVVDEEAQLAEEEAQLAEDQAQWEELQRLQEEYLQARANLDRAPWIGLGIQLALLVGSMALVIQRLRVPYKKLRSGTRVA